MAKRKKRASNKVRGPTRSLTVRLAEAEEKFELLKLQIERDEVNSEIRRRRIRLRSKQRRAF